MKKPRDPGHEPVLLLDELTVESTEGLEQRFFPLVKSPSNPTFIKTEPWEGEGVYNPIPMRNPETGQYQLWYGTYRFADNHYRWGYAVSDDGKEWEKPPLYIGLFEGQKARNMLPADPHPDKAGRSVVRDPRPDCDPQRRYKGIRFTYEGLLVAFSPDGIHWSEYEGNPVWHVPSDSINVLWDPIREKFVAYFKLWEVAGQRLDPQRPGHTKPFRAYMPTYDAKHRENRTDFSGPVVTFNPGGRSQVEQMSFSLAAEGQGIDDGGGGMLSGAWTSKRMVCWAESDDFIHWHHERVILSADEHDAPSANIQSLFVFYYGGYYIGVLAMHDERGQFNPQLGFSHDGLAWRRPWRENWLTVGPPGSFDSEMVIGPITPLILGDEIWLYYGGIGIPHHITKPVENMTSFAIGYATMRRDRFAAWVARTGTGTLLTQPLRCSGERLFVNTDAAGGRLEVEITDEAGHTIPGFERHRCEAVSVDATATEIRWGGMDTLSDLLGRTIRLRFSLSQALLYAFRFAPAE